MPTLPSHLEADLEDTYKRFLLSRRHFPAQGIDNMGGYPPALATVDTTYSVAEPDPADPVSSLEHDDAVSLESEPFGRRILPMPQLDRPDGPANLTPNLAEAESRPVSPLGPIRGGTWAQLAGLGEASDHESVASEVVQFRRSADVDACNEEKAVPGPLKIDQVSRENFRRRLREALEIVCDETKPLTLGSLTTVVEEIAELDARLSKMEQALESDRRATRYVIETTARSEAAASETRMRNEVTQLRRQIDTWRNQVPAPQPALGGPPLPTNRPPAVPTTGRSKKGCRRG